MSIAAPPIFVSRLVFVMVSRLVLSNGTLNGRCLGADDLATRDFDFIFCL